MGRFPWCRFRRRPSHRDFWAHMSSRPMSMETLRRWWLIRQRGMLSRKRSARELMAGPNRKSGWVLNGQVPSVVHPFRAVLAAGFDSAGALSAGLAGVAAVPDSGDSGGLGAGAGLGDRGSAGARDGEGILVG